MEILLEAEGFELDAVILKEVKEAGDVIAREHDGGDGTEDQGAIDHHCKTPEEILGGT